MAAAADSMASPGGSTGEEDSSTPSWDTVLLRFRDKASRFAHQAAVPAAGAVLALLLTGQSWVVVALVVRPLTSLVIQTLGVAIGIGLGLGLATHVYDLLTTYQERQDLRATSLSAASSLRLSRQTSQAQPLTSSSNANFLDDQTYPSLMQAAGYAVTEHKVLRGQVLRPDDAFFQRNYEFTLGYSEPGHRRRAQELLQTLFPVIPTSIHEQLSYMVELVLRDFVASWYSKADVGCIYVDEEQRQKDLKEGKVPDTSQSSPFPRRMVYTLAEHSRIPFLDKLYESMTILFGNLATRVEHVNVFELVLLKWTRILAHTFKVYRSLRKSVVTKTLSHQHRPSSSSSLSASLRGAAAEEAQPPPAPSEIAMTKEFLFAGKLHRAITFGLDVPSLLFADGTGTECGRPGNDHDVMPANEADDQVLEERLFGTPILTECELDYNRVIGHRMVRALLPRNDFGSGIVSSLVTEIVAGCILTPIMACFGPDYLNSWIIQGLDTTAEASDTAADADAAVDNNDEGLVRGWSRDENEELAAPSKGQAETDEMESPQQFEAADEVGNGAVLSIVDEEEASLASTSVDETSRPPLSIDSNIGSAMLPSPLAQTPSNESASMLSFAEHGTEAGDTIITHLAMALIELQRYVDFDEIRQAREENRAMNVDWDDPACRTAILQLVLVIEAALTNGRCIYRVPDDSANADIDNDVESDDDERDGSERSVEVTLPEYESTTLSQILMEMTGDIEAFEERVATENTLIGEKKIKHCDDKYAEDYQPTATEQSTLRTLIAAWLHTGQIYRTLAVLVQAHITVLVPFYRKQAFMRTATNASGFVRQLKALDGVDILVDTMAVLASPRLHETTGDEIRSLINRSSPSSAPAGLTIKDGPTALSEEVASPSSSLLQFMTPSATPRFLEFHRNEAFASSLRSERERRMQSWEAIAASGAEEGLAIICHSKGVKEGDLATHKELHHIARIFYSGTNLVAIRDAARRKTSDGVSVSDASEPTTTETTLALLTVETASARRRIEVPDDDSSFLLRAQPRPLNAVGVHRDQRNHDQSFKCFAATYEEPALNPNSEHYAGGRYIRRCLIRYYPIDRTASVALQTADARKLDQRKTKSSVPDTITLGQTARTTPFLSTEFLRERHLCQRWIPRGTTRSQSILASSVMEPSDFTAAPRTGKAIEFVYRMSFFERPMVDLGGKHFTVHDSASLGAHRADASALEMSDASLSFALLTVGNNEDGQRKSVEMGPDGYPVIWMKFSRKEDDAQVEVKSFRLSYVRAALLITSARHEAQLQNLVSCVRAGSAKNATKALTDMRLRPALRLLDYAGNRSREKQSVLLRDLKLGVNHIDREQLRRNGLLNPRYPTTMREIGVSFEDTVEAKDLHGVELFGATGILYKIRCSTLVDVDPRDDEVQSDLCYKSENGATCRTLREEWVVYRSFKDFQALHKHLKLQVSFTESSGTAGSRLVGAATAALAAGSVAQGRNRLRQALIPSLSQASKAGALGMTKKSLTKRREAIETYLRYLLAPGHLLNRCPEILLFIGALYPLPRDVVPGGFFPGGGDPLGRTEMKRVVVQIDVTGTDDENDEATNAESSVHRPSSVSIESQDAEIVEDADGKEQPKKSRKLIMKPAIRNKISKVGLSQVRNRLFELIRFLFGFENASFVRNRMLAAIKTASFAVTSNSEFQKTLYKLHTEQLSADAIAQWIKFTIELIWPDGVFFTSAPPTPAEQLEADSKRAKEILHESFPEQLRTVLGQDLTRDGLDVFHEMLQNRVVVKSMAYMLFDLVWLEVFPEIGDVLECGAVLDIFES